MQVWYESILEETLPEFRLNFGRGVSIEIFFIKLSSLIS